MSGSQNNQVDTFNSVFDVPDLVNLIADLCEDECVLKLGAVSLKDFELLLAKS